MVVSGRAHDYLQQARQRAAAVQQDLGLHMVYEDNEVQSFRTLLANLKGAVTGWPKNIAAYFELTERSSPRW